MVPSFWLEGMENYNQDALLTTFSIANKKKEEKELTQSQTYPNLFIFFFYNTIDTKPYTWAK